MNQLNKEGPKGQTAEIGEGRAQTKEKAGQPRTQPTPSGGSSVSQGLKRVCQAARAKKQERFTALLHHLTPELLKESFYGLKHEAAPGVDGVTWKEYGEGLGGRITDLHSRIHRGAYRAQPSKRAYIKKSDGKQRPLGIAALEDKVVQQAVVTILNAIYENDFEGYSYGFRPGRNPHQALDALTVGITRKRVNWVLDMDIRGFFDNMSHEWTERFVEHRVADRRILRLIRKWLKAGVCEEGEWKESEVGTPQGGVMTPRTQKITWVRP
jgi:group II intron reverse transcriptase/maturase